MDGYNEDPGQWLEPAEIASHPEDSIRTDTEQYGWLCRSLLIPSQHLGKEKEKGKSLKK